MKPTPIRGLSRQQKRDSQGQRGKGRDFTLAQARAEQKRKDKARRAARRQEKGVWPLA